MYPSSTSSSSHGSMGPSGSGGGGGLTRYGSAPSSVLSPAVDSVMSRGATRDFSALASSHHSPLGPSRYFSESAGKAAAAVSSSSKEHADNKSSAAVLQRSYNFHELAIGNGGTAAGGSTSTSPLVRHSSSPARFLNQLATAAGDSNGFQVSMGLGSCGLGVPESRRGVSRLNSQLSFTRQETLSQVAEENEDVVGGSSSNSMENNGQRKSTHSYATGSFGVGTSWRDQDHNHHHNHNHEQSIAFSHMGSWHEDKNQPVMFSITPGKRAKNANGDIAGGLNAMETQFGMPQVALEMASMDRYMQIPEDSVPCKIRAKRGCATHPRSIAERERRTRISGKLKKLQDLVPNMDKQTSYADMLDLAVQHIKCLQDKVQELHKELEHCTCGCKKTK
ncbi:transcription factor bHLH128-like isoform X2 [Ipomoea triloba]|uniref:transcription factor bHLH128-like isoform X2 n=1 Tax=Ipomoea triloba TaxID=35885 RepID=UPI00125D5F16|nr:transcription factor bHLH128-like isoform X2 [Ipomoea triloba]